MSSADIHALAVSECEIGDYLSVPKPVLPGAARSQRDYGDVLINSCSYREVCENQLVTRKKPFREEGPINQRTVVLVEASFDDLAGAEKAGHQRLVSETNLMAESSSGSSCAAAELIVLSWDFLQIAGIFITRLNVVITILHIVICDTNGRDKIFLSKDPLHGIIELSMIILRTKDRRLRIGHRFL